MKTKSVIGLVLAVFAALKLFDLFGWWHFDWLYMQPWTEYVAPFAMLYFGLEMLFYNISRDRDHWLSRAIPEVEEGKRIHCAVSYGGDEYVYNGEHFHGATLDAAFGGICMDLRQAVIDEDEEIDTRTLFGGIVLYVPTNVNVVVRSRSFFGGVGNHTFNRENQNLPTLYIVASNMFGGVHVEN
jgi:predicted membrane protein